MIDGLQKEQEISPPFDLDRLLDSVPDEVWTGIYFWYWPMIITHRMVAGAEGTTIVVSSLPPESGAGDSDFLSFLKLVEGDEATVTLPDQTAVALAPGVNNRFNVTGAATPTQQPPTAAHNAYVTMVQDLMEAGWIAAFEQGGQEDPPQ